MNTEPEQVRRLYGLRTFGIRFGLERIQALLSAMGNPERELNVIHVAGTNGKGSVCALIESALRTAGYRTGIYTSPHLVRLNERMRVNGREIGQRALLELIETVDGHVAELPADMEGITFFEFTTAMAFEHFRRSEADIVVLETGMGGRLDATNVVDPLISVITRVGLEHMQYLGDDIESIAVEKGGIIKAGRPVVCAEMSAEALQVLRQIADERDAPFVTATEMVSVSRASADSQGQKVVLSSTSTTYPRVLLPLSGKHQLENAAVAVAAIEVLTAHTSITADEMALANGFESVRWPARCQVLSQDPLVIVDGAHNPDAASALSGTIKELADGRPVGLVIAMCDDKDIGGFLGAFEGVARKCWATTVNNDRSVDPDGIAEIARGRGWATETADIAEAVAGARRWASEEDGVVCIAGSLYLAGAVLAGETGSVFEVEDEDA